MWSFAMKDLVVDYDSPTEVLSMSQYVEKTMATEVARLGGAFSPGRCPKELRPKDVPHAYPEAQAISFFFNGK